MTYLQYAILTTPVGPLLLCADKDSLRNVCWHSEQINTDAYKSWSSRDTVYFGRSPQPNSIIAQANTQLREYFANKRTTFDIPLWREEGSDFQKSVWRALEAIPYGQTCSYGELAKSLGNPNASRAVGSACGSNPISIITPCHRVIGGDGDLTGFAGGKARKEILLTLESN